MSVNWQEHDDYEQKPGMFLSWWDIVKLLLFYGSIVLLIWGGARAI